MTLKVNDPLQKTPSYHDSDVSRGIFMPERKIGSAEILFTNLFTTIHVKKMLL